jgi:hypothetical protein
MDEGAPPREGLQLDWRDLSFDVELTDIVAKAQAPGPDGELPKWKRILHGVTAQAPSNSLMAVMVRKSYIPYAYPVLFEVESKADDPDGSRWRSSSHLPC